MLVEEVDEMPSWLPLLVLVALEDPPTAPSARGHRCAARDEPDQQPQLTRTHQAGQSPPHHDALSWVSRDTGLAPNWD